MGSEVILLRDKIRQLKKELYEEREIKDAAALMMVKYKSQIKVKDLLIEEWNLREAENQKQIKDLKDSKSALEIAFNGKLATEKAAYEARINGLKEEMEEYGRLAFYRGREIDTYTKYGEPIFKRPTYNGYLRELNKH
jgi:hypothetical protein